MNKKNKNVKIKLILILVFVPFLSLLSCRSSRTQRGSDFTGISEASEEAYRNRPRIQYDGPRASLPYSLEWDRLYEAKCFEIQSAADERFTQSRKSWITRDTSLVLKTLDQDLTYFRVRAQFEVQYSRWSDVIRILRTDDSIELIRLRD